MTSLNGKVALVTGSATGIGAAIARRLAEEGARVATHDREAGDEERFVADLADPEACAGLVEAVIARFGRLDILVNNAALTTRSNLETTDAEVFDRIIAVNLRAPLLLVRAALPHFRRQGGGCVLNIGSVNGYCGEASLLAYSVSKGGLMTLSRNLADAYGLEGIRVNHLNVGWTLTPNEYALKIRDGLPEDWPQRLPKSTSPAGRLLSPEEIAHFALAFIADTAVSGAVVEIEQYPIIGRNPPKRG